MSNKYTEHVIYGVKWCKWSDIEIMWIEMHM